LVETQKKQNGKSIQNKKNKLPKPRKTEVNAYIFIRDELRNLGWNTKNPERDPEGQVYTQNECLENEEIKKFLDKERPEAIVKVTETKLWVIESKKEHRQKDQALKEAKEQYAEKINKSDQIQVAFVSGVAGNDYDGYIIETEYFDGKHFHPVTINKRNISGFLIQEQLLSIIENNKPDIEELPFDDRFQRLFLQKAEKINEILHRGAINKNKRARVMSALLLSLIDENPLIIDSSPSVLINDINTRVSNVLDKQGKPRFYDFIKLALPTKSDNHHKHRKALVDTIQQLRSINIRSAMESGTDILGKFYEVFLKYGNGAKEIGIVLTPRHITKFAVEVMNVTHNDIILDPACGTGGFLVASFDHVRKNANMQQLNRFKQKNLFGIEQDDEVVSLAIVNMIFRGDGKNNIIEGNCFKNSLLKTDSSAKYIKKEDKNKIRKKQKEKNDDKEIDAVTKVLMNPPFALKDESEKAYQFVDYGLDEMQDGGILFSILPYSNLVKSAGFLTWRKELLKKHTLLSGITFPFDLFYPIGVHSVGIFIKKGVPHDKKQNVLWIRALNDGFLKSKGKRLPNSKIENDFEKIRGVLTSFLINPTINVDNIQELQKACPIDFNDKMLELVPEVYLDEEKPSEEKIKLDIDYCLRNLLSYLINSDKEKDFRENIIDKENIFSSDAKGKTSNIEVKEIPISDIFETPIDTGFYHVSGSLDDGDIPLISCSSINDGVETYVDVEDQIFVKKRNKDVAIKTTYDKSITIASDGMPLSTFYHYYKFCAKDNVLVCFPKEEYKFTTIMYLISELNRLKWRFSYGRKAYKNKIDKIKIFIPMDENDNIDEDYIEQVVKSVSSWDILKRLFSGD